MDLFMKFRGFQWVWVDVDRVLLVDFNDFSGFGWMFMGFVGGF